MIVSGPMLRWSTSTCCTAQPGCSLNEQSPLRRKGNRQQAKGERGRRGRKAKGGKGRI